MFPDLFRDDVFRIETRRLWLRWPTAKDGARILTLAGDRAVAEMAAHIPHPLGRADVADFVLQARAANLSGAGLTLALCERGRPGTLIGLSAIERAPDEGAPQLGYWLGQPYWGAGLASEAAAALVGAWFAWAGGGPLESAARTANPASRRVLEKCGFAWAGRGAMDAPAWDGAVEVDRFRLDRGLWAARRAAAVPAPLAAA